MTKRNLGSFAVCAMLFALCSSAEAQQPTKIPRIGYLSALDSVSESDRSDGVRLALRERGYIEGQNIAIEYRYAEQKLDRLPELSAELVRLKVDVIVVSGGDSLVRAVMNATSTIPIVMMGAGVDPVGAGLVESIPRPGGNVTGLFKARREAAGAAQRNRSQSCSCRGFLRSGHSGHSTRGERGSPGRGPCAALR
jgi:ABC-type uncharacterized transport system substrate-binding protein